jgi:hypothetical protein
LRELSIKLSYCNHTMVYFSHAVVAGICTATVIWCSSLDSVKQKRFRLAKPSNEVPVVTPVSYSSTSMRSGHAVCLVLVCDRL